MVSLSGVRLILPFQIGAAGLIGFLSLLRRCPIISHRHCHQGSSRFLIVAAGKMRHLLAFRFRLRLGAGRVSLALLPLVSTSKSESRVANRLFSFFVIENHLVHASIGLPLR